MSELPETPLLPALRRRRRDSRDCHTAFRIALPASVVVAFLLFVFTSGILDETRRREQPDVVFPDFSHYKHLLTLPHNHFPIHPDDPRRIVAIGDIHAMNQSLSALLDQISYDPQTDTLIHLGDLVSKSKKLSSDPVLNFMSTNRVLGVRGNNDQKVIEWRAWMDWIKSLPGGSEWLKDMDSKFLHIDGDDSHAQVNTWLKNSYKKWEPYVPVDWKLHGKHYKVGRKMSQEQFDYLRSLPIILHAPTAHTFFVHAGVLPADPALPFDDPRQPLSHLPTTANPEEDVVVLRRLQERALLSEVPQNEDPWVLMNMRSLKKDGQVTDGKKGTPWSDVWNTVMEDCTGLSATYQSPTANCFPSMVLYGHAASRDLDVKRWSIGLDTGCAYGSRLTAVVLDFKSFLQAPAISDASLHDSIRYGDDGVARLVSVKCQA